MTCPMRFLYRAATGKDVPPGPCVCCLCGLPCGDAVPVTDVIRDTFTNHGMCRASHSQDVCAGCAHYFCHRWDTGQKYEAEYRKHSHFVTADQWRSWPRAEMRGDIETMLRNGCLECVLVVGLSKKKHCLPLAVVNPPGRSFVVQLEEEQVRLSSAWFPLAAAFDALLALGCFKGQILSGNYSSVLLRKVGAKLPELLRHDKTIARVRPSALLTLLSYVTILEDADDDAGGTHRD